MTFGLIQYCYIIAAAHDLWEIEVIPSEPTFIPIHVHRGQLIEQPKKEVAGSGLPMMAMADAGNLQLC